MVEFDYFKAQDIVSEKKRQFDAERDTEENHPGIQTKCLYGESWFGFLCTRATHTPHILYRHTTRGTRSYVPFERAFAIPIYAYVLYIYYVCMYVGRYIDEDNAIAMCIGYRITWQREFG